MKDEWSSWLRAYAKFIGELEESAQKKTKIMQTLAMYLYIVLDKVNDSDDLPMIDEHPIKVSRQARDLTETTYEMMLEWESEIETDDIQEVLQ